jgi:hypothetical protein
VSRFPELPIKRKPRGISDLQGLPKKRHERRFLTKCIGYSVEQIQILNYFAFVSECRQDFEVLRKHKGFIEEFKIMQDDKKIKDFVKGIQIGWINESFDMNKEYHYKELDIQKMKIGKIMGEIKGLRNGGTDEKIIDNQIVTWDESFDLLAETILNTNATVKIQVKNKWKELAFNNVSTL